MINGLALFLIFWITFAIAFPRAVGVWMAMVKRGYDKEMNRAG